MPPVDHISLNLPDTTLGFFIPLLGAGVGIRTPLGISLQDFLCNGLGIAPDYLRDRIQTIFVNGRAVDRPEAVVIDAGTVVALSAAMPGLVGAVLRRGGPLAAMRREISQQSAAAGPSESEGFVTLKLFNLVAKELGVHLLENGIWLPETAFRTLWHRITTEIAQHVSDLYWNDQCIAFTELNLGELQFDRVHLQVHWKA